MWASRGTPKSLIVSSSFVAASARTVVMMAKWAGRLARATVAGSRSAYASLLLSGPDEVFASWRVRASSASMCCDRDLFVCDQAVMLLSVCLAVVSPNRRLARHPAASPNPSCRVERERRRSHVAHSVDRRQRELTSEPSISCLMMKAPGTRIAARSPRRGDAIDAAARRAIGISAEGGPHDLALIQQDPDGII